MTSYFYLLIGFTAGCIWMGISFLTAYWWCNCVNRMDRAREQFERNSI